mmetsp:Transcript_115826/g.374253  ORF Transcript_115826/g.374253 Transcript_115826/m.374253 type:complete len:597 (-) Transcript_115826:406-2196(-)
MRLRPDFGRVLPLLAQWKVLVGRTKEQLLLLDALSSDILLTYPHIRELCRHREMVGEILWRLVPAVAGGQAARYLAMLLVPTMDLLLKLLRDMGSYLRFNPENPTGHYLLDLRIASDYAVAQSLLLLDRWEAMVAKSEGCTDRSMHGDWSNVRNCVHESSSVRLVTEWHLPTSSTLVLDYATWRRPPRSAAALGDEAWNRLLISLSATSCTSAQRALALHRVSGQLYLRAVQLRELLASFRTKRDREEVVAGLFFRLVDPQNAKLLRAQMGDRGEWQELRRRLGTLATLALYQPEESVYEMNLGTYEDRVATSVLLQLACRERLENVRDPSLIFPDGTHFKFEYGIPQQWNNDELLPDSGRLTFRYQCSPGDRAMAMRSELSRRYSGWRVDVGSEGVMWWRSLAEAPEPLLVFLYHCMRHCRGPDDFYRLATERSGGQLSRADFQAAVARVGWRRFLDEPELLKQAFRALDPDGSGAVSPAEWAAVEQLWRELLLSVLEFLAHADRVFGGDLEVAWEQLDSDASGSLELDEWQAAVQLVGWFGPMAPVFHLIADEDRTISRSSWETLKAFWDDRESLRKQILGRPPEDAAAAPLLQ